MSTTPNYNLTVYAADDLTTKFYNYRTATSGDTSTSNFMIIDSTMKQLADSITDLENTPGLIQVSATGTNNYTATVTDFTYIAGQSIVLSVNTTNTGASTLNINSLGVRPLMKYNLGGSLVQLDAGDLRGNMLYLFANISNNWVLVGFANAGEMNIAGNEGDILIVNGDNTIESSGLNLNEVARSVTRLFNAGVSMVTSVIVGLNENNQWVPLRSTYSFPIGTWIGITDDGATANIAAPVTVTGYTPFLTTGLTLNPSPLTVDTTVFMKGSINESGDFVPADTLTTILEPDASYMELGYIVNDNHMVLSEKHTIYTLDVDGNIEAIDNIPLGGSGAGSTTQIFSIGDGSTTQFTLNHGGDTTLVNLLVRTTASPQTYLVPDWAIIDNNNIQLNFDIAPSNNEYQALVFVMQPRTSVTMYKQTIGDGTSTEYYIHHNLGVSAPNVKLVQLTDNAYVYSGIYLVDEDGTASNNTLKLTFASAVPAGAIDVYVDSNIVEVGDTQSLAGQPASSYEWRELIYENEVGLALNQTAGISVQAGDVLEIEYNYTSRPYPSETEPTIYDTTFFRFRSVGGYASLWPNGESEIHAYQINGNDVDNVVEIKAYIRTSTTGLGIMSRYTSPPSGFSGTITNSQLFKLKRIWKIHNV